MSAVKAGEHWVYDGFRYTIVYDPSDRFSSIIVRTKDVPYASSIPVKVQKMVNVRNRAGSWVIGTFWIPVLIAIVLTIANLPWVAMWFVVAAVIGLASAGTVYFKNTVRTSSNIHGRFTASRKIQHKISLLLRFDSIRHIVLKEIFEGRHDDFENQFGGYIFNILEGASGTKIEDEVNDEVVSLISQVTGEEFNKLDSVERWNTCKTVVESVLSLNNDVKEYRKNMIDDVSSRRGWKVPLEGSRSSESDDDSKVALIEPRATVGAVKDEIGRLRSDIGWVNDNPAFFDSYSSVSSNLFEALGNWDDMGFQNVKPTHKELSEAALKIEELFEKAKMDAERIGFDHLNGQSRINVEKASKLVKKAESTKSVDEHDALMGKAAELLVGIMDVILPRQAVEALERYNPAAISHKIEEASEMFEGELA